MNIAREIRLITIAHTNRYCDHCAQYPLPFGVREYTRLTPRSTVYCVGYDAVRICEYTPVTFVRGHTDRPASELQHLKYEFRIYKTLQNTARNIIHISHLFQSSSLIFFFNISIHLKATMLQEIIYQETRN